MHRDSLYLLRCSMHFLVHPAAHPGGTENLHMHYSCQSRLQVASEELEAPQRDIRDTRSQSQKEQHSSITLKAFQGIVLEGWFKGRRISLILSPNL